MFANIFGYLKKPEKKTLGAELFNNILEYGINNLSDQLPNKDELVNYIKSEFQKKAKPELEKFNLQLVMDQTTSLIYSFFNSRKDIIDSDQLTKIINQNKIKIDSENIQFNFQDKFKSCQAYWQFLKLIKKYSLNILIIGPYQSGKSSLIKRIFSPEGLSPNPEFDMNIIEFSLFDPQSPPNIEEKILETIKNTNFDLILYVAKIGDIFMEFNKKFFEKINSQFGLNFWKKTIYILTHANSGAPDEYYMTNGQLDPKITSELAWNKFINLKTEYLRSELLKLNLNINIPIIPMENSVINTKRIGNICVLPNNTPILENLITNFFKILEYDKIPLLFLILTNNYSPDKPIQEIHQSVHNASNNISIIINPPEKLNFDTWIRSISKLFLKI